MQKIHFMGIILVIIMMVIGIISLSRPSSQTAHAVDDLFNPIEDERQQEPFIYVDIKGEVKHPGIYKVPYGSRLYTIINQAGGFTENANQYTVNLAQRMHDGSMIIVPHINQPVEDVENKDDRISISQASLEQLIMLPNIGPSTAQAIISHREEHGPFETIEAIMDVRGIGLATFDAIKPFIRP